MPIPGVRTFADHVAQRQSRKGLAEGRAAINDLIRSSVRHKSAEEVRIDNGIADVEVRQASLDQGSRGATPPREPGVNDGANDALRRMFRHEPADDFGEERSTPS